MQTPRRQYPAWKAPSDDGATLIWPEPKTILENTIANQRLLTAADSVRVQKIPLPEIRNATRRFIGVEDQQPLLAMGHQTELIHAGVWAKNCLIDAAARKLNGRAYHLAVDTDAPKHLHLRWPGESLPITDDPHIASAAWCGQLAPPTPAHINSILEKVPASQKPVLPEVLQSLRRLAMDANLNLSSALTNALHQLDWNLGLGQHVLLASPIWNSPAFLLFVHDLIANADSVATHYNGALECYRSAHGIRSHMRPMPDLVLSPGAVEIPFWLDDLQSGTRSRPSVFHTDGGWILKLLTGEEFIFEKNLDGWEAASRLQRWLISMNHRIAPRALMLTMFFRMFMVDQFVHGIGGGQYDQVTDELISRHYGIEPPTIAVTTATLYLTESIGRERVCVPCVRNEGHRLKHALLGERKMEYVRRMESLPRRSPARMERFVQMHKELSAAASANAAMSHWSEKLRETRQREQEEHLLFDRELFYAMQPRERLVGMIERFNSVFD